MIKKITLLLVAIAITSCGVRNTRTSLASGNYDQAIQNSVEKLRYDKGKQDYVYLLEEAFAKAKERDLQNINAWQREGSANNLENIYNAYQHQVRLQELIRPLLPLRLIKENRNAIFPFEDYTDEIIQSKIALANFLYNNGKALLASKDKMDIRQAYNDLIHADNLNANFKDIKTLIDQAKQKGTDYVCVSTKNESNMVIPVRLEKDLLDFSTYGLNDSWTVYHSTRLKTITYDYNLVVNIRSINISPEQIREKEFIKEKQIKDGTKLVKDEKGNSVKVDNMKTVRATIYESRQFKTVEVVAKVDYVDFKSNQLINTFPLAGGYTFEHIYSRYNGERSACESDYLAYFDQRAVPFPTNEQMVYDSAEDLKAKLKGILTQNKFRK